MRCDYIAEGVIKATQELKLDIPLVVRLKGTKEVEAKQYVPLTSYQIKPSNWFLQDDQGFWLENYSL
jgi:succinyl-CoA synthetase beta subunit